MEQPRDGTEYIPDDIYARHFEAMRACYDTPEFREQFDAAVSAAQALATDSNSLQALTYTAEIYRWGYWGDYAEATPAGITMVNTHEGIKLHFDGQLLDTELFEEASQVLSVTGLTDFVLDVSQKLIESEDDLKPLKLTLLENHPVIRLFSGIAEQETDETYERPLTEREKLIGASIIAHETKALFGLLPHQSIAGETAAELYLERRLLQQEVMTTEEPAPYSQAYETVRSILESYAPTLIGQYKYLEDDLIATEAEALMAMRDEAARMDETDYFGAIAKAILHSLRTPDAYGYEAINHFGVGKCLLNLYANTEGSVKKTLDITVSDETNVLYDHLVDGIGARSHPHPESGLEVFAWINRPAGVTEPEVPRGYSTYTAKYALYDITHGNMWENNPRIPGEMGTVQADTLLHQGRLMQFKPSEAPFIEADEIPEHSLRLTIDNIHLPSYEVAPYIPGYALLGQHIDYYAGTYYFEIEDGDPYAECPIIIGERGRQKLADTYATMGMEALSDDVAEQAALTISVLTGLIARHSVYLDGVASSSSRRVSSLRNCTEFVRDGQLVTQCTGSRIFLRESIKTALYAEERTDFALLNFNGYALDTATIPLEAHTQLGFIENGVLYILDATPSANVRATGREPYELARSNRVRHTPARFPERRSMPKEISNEDRLRNLEQMLAPLFNATPGDRAALQEALVALPRDDPNRQTYEFSLGMVTDPEQFKPAVRSLRTLLRKVRTAAIQEPELLKGTAYQHYQTRLQQLDNLDIHLSSYLQDPEIV